MVLIVADVVLDSRRDALGLDTLDNSSAHGTSQDWVLAEAFKTPPTKRGSWQIHGRAEQDRNAFRDGLIALESTGLSNQVGISCCS